MKSFLNATIAAVAGLVLALPAGAQSAQLSSKKTLTLAVAKQLAAVAEQEAAKRNFKVVIAIADEGGNLIYLEKMDDVQIASVEISTEKAHSAVIYKRPTKYFHDGLLKGNTSLLKLPGLIMTDGGVPLIVDGKVIGGIGVSGGAPPKDDEIAQATADSLAKIAQ
jgi:glc operon protein GlcG